MHKWCFITNIRQVPSLGLESGNVNMGNQVELMRWTPSFTKAEIEAQKFRFKLLLLDCLSSLTFHFFSARRGVGKPQYQMPSCARTSFTNPRTNLPENLRILIFSQDYSGFMCFYYCQKGWLKYMTKCFFPISSLSILECILIMTEFLKTWKQYYYHT